MTRARAGLGSLLRGWVPEAVKARTPQRLKARMRAILGIEPWPDLAVRHRLFRTPEYRALRLAARSFDVAKPNKPVLERGHQASYLLSRWLSAAGVGSAFHVGYASGRHVFYLSRSGITCAGTDLPADASVWGDVPEGALDAATRRRLLRVSFFDLTRGDLRSVWAGTGVERVDVLMSEATFETFLPWRATGVSVPGYFGGDPEERRALMHERFPAKVAELGDEVSNMLFIEPEPGAGAAGAVFAACAGRLPGFAHSVWAFRPPFDRLFQLSPRFATRQTVYAFTRDARLLETLGVYAVSL
jgi:hypothetical protein